MIFSVCGSFFAGGNNGRPACGDFMLCAHSYRTHGTFSVAANFFMY